MARLNDKKWELLQADFEVRGMSLAELSHKYSVGRSTISEKAKREGWEKGKHEHLVIEKVNAVKALEKNRTETEQLPNSVQKAIDKDADYLLEMEGIFKASLQYNQVKATNLLKKKANADDLTLADLNLHSQITVRNMDRVMGKTPDTAIQINNNSNNPPSLNVVFDN
jgi:lambda repressor-like predicted transcriptional regulator